MQMSYQLSTRSAGPEAAPNNEKFYSAFPTGLGPGSKEGRGVKPQHVGNEHRVPGLIKLGEGVAVNVLQKMGLDLERVRKELEKHVGSHPETKMIGNIPYTPRVKKVLALADREAKALNHSYVGTEHLLLGLLREGEGVAA